MNVIGKISKPVVVNFSDVFVVEFVVVTRSFARANSDKAVAPVAVVVGIFLVVDAFLDLCGKFFFVGAHKPAYCKVGVVVCSRNTAKSGVGRAVGTCFFAEFVGAYIVPVANKLNIQQIVILAICLCNL